VTFGNAELDLSEDAENDWAPDNNQAADVGTLVHRYLEFIATDGMDAWPETRIEKAKPRMIAWFTLHRHSLKQANELAEVVIQHLKTTLQSDDGRWLLTHREIAGAEVALTQHNDEVSLTHIIDRTFVEEGVRWIIDYKTTEIDSKNVPNGGQETIEGFKQQLERYEALFNATENQIKLGIYYTSAGRLVEL
jgi:ATP-dependent exoDNAse (exonuclease V) beta subunit